MSVHSFLLTLFLALLIQVSQAQDSIPFLKGKVNISVTRGTIECDFTLSNIPRIENYVIRINSGMNIRSFKSQGSLQYFERDRHDTMSSGESLSYYFPGPQKVGKLLPQEIECKYVGMYPVMADSITGYGVEDWRGNVAFNGYSLRADGIQSAWYPVLYDMTKDVIYEKVKYDVDISCTDCNALYVNGNKPVKGKWGNFKSNIPQELTLYCGNYEIADLNGTYILNPDTDSNQQKLFGAIVNSYKNYLEQHLNIPYKGDITFIQTTPVAPEYGFLFVSYPTIINIGTGEDGLKKVFDRKNGDLFKPYIAHELGHYYFGHLLRINTEFGPVINEGFTEYLSFKVTQNVIAENIYQKKIGDKIKALQNFKPVPIAQFKTKADFNNRNLYVYSYVPIVLTAIEKIIGQETMWKWLKIMIASKPDFTNYHFLEKTLELAVRDKIKLEQIKNTLLGSDKSLENAIEIITNK